VDILVAILRQRFNFRQATLNILIQQLHTALKILMYHLRFKAQRNGEGIMARVPTPCA
jgi:hypothetical protein